MSWYSETLSSDATCSISFAIQIQGPFAAELDVKTLCKLSNASEVAGNIRERQREAGNRG
jgi:hypothetical protein